MAKSQVVKEHSETLSGHSCRQAVGVGFVLMAILVPLYFSPLFYEYEIPKLVIFQVLTVAMAVLWVVGMVLDGEIYLLDTTIYYTFLAFLAVHFISLFQAGNVFQGMDALFRYLCYFLIPVLIFHVVRKPSHIYFLAGTMMGTGALVAFIGLLQHNRIYSLYAPGNISLSTIGNVNFVAEYYNVVFPISLTLIFLFKRPWLKGAAVASCFLMACHLVVLNSRGGWLGAGVGFAVIGGMVLLRHFQVGRRIVDLAVVAVVVLGLSWPVAAGLLSGIPLGPERTLGGLTRGYWEQMVGRSEDAVKLQDDSSRQRVLLWWDTLRLIADRPLVGVGVGNFEYNLPRYASLQSLEVKQRMEKNAGQSLMAYRAHNEYLEVWAETGILGFGIFCFLLYQILASLFKLLRRYLHGEQDLFVVGLAAAVAATLAHAFFSTNFQDPASAVHFWMVVGLIWSVRMNVEGETRLGLLFTQEGGISFGLISGGILALIMTVVMGVQTLLGAYYYQVGSIWFKRENYWQAIAAMEKAAEYRYTNDFAVYQNLGLSFYNTKHWTEAAEAFRQSLLRHRNNVQVHYYLGLTLGQLERDQEAVAHLHRAVELNPLSSKYHMSLGEALGLAGNPEMAVFELRESLRIEPEQADAYYALGANYKRLGNLDATAEAYQKALALAPGDDRVMNSLAVVYASRGELEKAREVFQRLVEQYPDRVDYRVNLAAMLQSLGRLQEALDACGEALKRDPDFVNAYAVLGSIFEAGGEIDRARQVYREALSRAPNHAAVQSRLRALESEH
ncbi:MAG: tetratricopeptide repeat protein [bacterium]|nr:tetratricopeptide repeat protein [bacterium]